MLVLSWRELDRAKDNDEDGFESECFWKNFILRLWLYRTTVQILTKLSSVKCEAKDILKSFDAVFTTNEENTLKTLRDVFEHFDDYAADMGRNAKVDRVRDVDPWRIVTTERYERGQFVLERKTSYAAAIKLRDDAKQVSDSFIAQLKLSREARQR